jgi:hypothetical protein
MDINDTLAGDLSNETQSWFRNGVGFEGNCLGSFKLVSENQKGHVAFGPDSLDSGSDDNVSFIW